MTEAEIREQEMREREEEEERASPPPKKAKKAEVPKADEAEQDMNKMMMSNKQKKLYERMKYGEKKRIAEVSIYFISLCRK